MCGENGGRLRSRLARMVAWLGEASRDVQIPGGQRRSSSAALPVIEKRFSDRREATIAAYETGQYTYVQLGEHFGVHHRWPDRSGAPQIHEPGVKRVIML